MAFMSNSNNAYFELDQARQNFWNRNANLSEDQRQALWMQAALAAPASAFQSTQSSMAHQTPRTMPIANMSQLSVGLHPSPTLSFSNSH